ncbi:hypothetical protein ACFL56_01405 [Candidatus Margulisiibacteriota bacterium]
MSKLFYKIEFYPIKPVAKTTMRSSGRNRRNHKLCLDLQKGVGEKGVDKIVKKDPILSKNKNWKAFGDNESNLSLIYNQSKEELPPLIELAINSIDAMLLLYCKLAGIDPKSQEINSMRIAVAKFFEMNSRDIIDSTIDDLLNQLFEIQIIAEGGKESPDLVFTDNGEGQHVTNFSKTFCALANSIKLAIHFVQGQYNAGGKGVLKYCGEEDKYMLIISRQHPELLKIENESRSVPLEDSYGFTLVRLKEAEIYADGTADKLPKFEYAVDEDGKPFTFSFSYVDSLTDKKTSGSLPFDLYNKTLIEKTNQLKYKPKGFEWGTYIKLYSYNLPIKRETDITNEGGLIYKSLNTLLFEPALPVLLVDKRYLNEKTKEPKIAILHGNFIRIKRDAETILEREFTSSIVFDFKTKNSDSVEVPLDIYVFNHDDHGETYTDGENAVLLTINGQTHFKMGKNFIQNDLEFTHLKNRILINVKFDDIKDPNIRSEIFMANRESVPTNVAKKIKEALKTTLKKDKLLMDINERLHNDKILNNKQDPSKVQSILRHVSKNLKNIKNFMKLQGKLKSSFEKKILEKSTERIRHNIKKPKLFKGKEYPTKLHFRNKTSGDVKAVELPINGKQKIQLVTDVIDSFEIDELGRIQLSFPRVTRRSGKKKIKSRGKTDREYIHVVRRGPHDGYIDLLLEPGKYAEVGDEVEIKLELFTNDREHCYEALTMVKIMEKSDPVDTVQVETPESYDMPNIILVYNSSLKKEIIDNPAYQNPVFFGPDEDNDYKKWTPEDICTIVERDKRVDSIAINMHSLVMWDQEEKLREKHLDPIIFDKKLEIMRADYQAIVIILSMLMYGSLRTLHEDRIKEDENYEYTGSFVDDTADFVRMMAPLTTMVEFKE